MDGKPAIDPANLPLWTIASFVIATIALIMAFLAHSHGDDVLLAVQSEILMLNRKVDDGMHRPTAAAPQVKSSDVQDAKGASK